MKLHHRITGRHRLMLLLAALLTAGFLATSLGSYWVSKREIHASIVDRELPLTSDTVYSEIQKDLVRPVFISSMMASDTFLRDWVLHGERDVAQMTKYLKEVKSRYGAFTSFFVAEGSATYYHADGILKKVRPEEPRDAWYYRVQAMTEPYEINVDPDMANRDVLTIFVNYRVLDYQGRYLGATGIGLTVDAVRHLLSDYQKRYQRSVYFVNATGKVVLFGNQTLPGNDIRAVDGLRAIADHILSSPAGSYQYRLEGRDHLLNVRYVPELKWYLFVEKVEDDALSGIRRTLYLNLAVCAAVTVFVLLLTGVTLRRYQDRLEEMATTDKLTGLANRQTAEILLPRILADARRSQAPLAAVLIDIDNFKGINDQYGHLAGDRVLQRVAGLIAANLRASDLACRWGGEEFLLLLKDCAGEQALALADKLRSIVADAATELESEAVRVTLSAGVALYLPPQSPEQLINGADQALYAAKRGGRNRAVLEGADAPVPED